MTASALSKVYAGAAPYYSEHGWAFSYTGHHAAIISITQPDMHKRAVIWSMAIEADLISGNPKRATVEQLESKILWAPRAYAPKYPHYTMLGISLLSFDTSYGVAAPDKRENFALDVFFSPSSEDVKIVRYSLTPSYVESMVDERPDRTHWFCGNLLPNHLDLYGAEYFTGTWTRTWSNTLAHVCEGFERPTVAERPYNDTNLAPIHLPTITHKGGHVYINVNLVLYNRVYTDHYEAQLTIYGGAGFRRLDRGEAFFKPFLDRELFALYEKRREYRFFIGSTIQTMQGLASGNYWQHLSGGGALVEILSISMVRIVRQVYLLRGVQIGISQRII